MSDSAQWWTIGLLVAFMIIGLAMIFLSRGQKDSAPSTFDGNDTVAPAYVPVGLLTSSSVIEPTSADVTLTRFLYAADAVADGIGNAAAKSAALSSIDVTAVEDAGMAATLAEGGDMPDVEQSVASPSALTTEPAIPVVGTEISERDWTIDQSRAAAVATGDATGTHGEAVAGETVAPDQAMAAQHAEETDESAITEHRAAAERAATAEHAPASEQVGVVGQVGAADVASETPSAAPMSSVGSSDATIQTVQIAELHHGADGHEHASEWIVIANESAETVNLAGWRLTDEGEKHVYTFPPVGLATGGRLNVYMAQGTDTAAALYVGRSQRWWNNDGDCAYLFDAAGTLVDRHCYGSAAQAG